MYRDETWTPADRFETEAVIRELPPFPGHHLLSADTTRAAWRRLTFYPDIVLLRLREPAWNRPTLAIYHFVTPWGGAGRLAKDTSFFTALNDHGHLKLTDANALDYLRFCCFFTFANGHRFLLLESADDCLLPPDLDRDTCDQFRLHVRPPRITGIGGSGEHLCEGVAVHEDEAFTAKFKINGRGAVEMTDFQPHFRLPAPIDLPSTWE